MTFFFASLLSLVFINCFGQSSDTSATTISRRKVLFSSQNPTNGNNQFRSFETPAQKNYKSKENILLATHNLQMSPVENEITDLESRECVAIEKRDTLMLRLLWSRDFTLDEPQNEISISGKNPLPFYTSYFRFVENCSMVDDKIYTSGYELVQRLKLGGTLEDPIRRNYFHVWTKKEGFWKLTTKTHN